MLTPVEKILFTVAVGLSLYFTWRGVRRIITIISSGQGKPDWRIARSRIMDVFFKVVSFQPVFRYRFVPSLFHALIGWGFLCLLVIDLADSIYALTRFRALDHLGLFGRLYLSFADIATVTVLIGTLFMAVRRFVVRPANLSTRETTLLDPRARSGIKRDSLIVVLFIVICNSARLFTNSFYLAGAGGPNVWEPVASALAGIWSGMDANAIALGEHAFFWVYFGSILAFLPYFPYSKHVHMFFAPLNFALKPERKSIGQMGYINLDDQSIEQFGAARLGDLGWEQVMDSYACIMCFRCQEVCPAYNTGKLLSPAALEINKRYRLNHGGALDAPLLEYAINRGVGLGVHFVRRVRGHLPGG